MWKRLGLRRVEPAPGYRTDLNNPQLPRTRWPFFTTQVIASLDALQKRTKLDCICPVSVKANLKNIPLHCLGKHRHTIQLGPCAGEAGRQRVQFCNDAALLR